MNEAHVNAEVNYDNIWSHILQDVQNSTKKSPPIKSIVVLGDNESGRSSLIARLKGTESVSKGLGIEYHYIDVKDENRDEPFKLSIWIPDGDCNAKTSNELLKYALNETNIDNTLVMLVASMSTPWNMMQTLNKWHNLLADHLSKNLNLNKERMDKLRRLQMYRFKTYQEPDDVTVAQQQQQQQQNGSLNKKLKSNMDNVEQQLDQVDIEAMMSNNDTTVFDSSEIMKNCLGLATIVVVTKTDIMSQLEKENDFKVEHFDFIQYSLRKFCLELGAALFYTTIKEKRLFEKLYRYILHALYNYKFNYQSSIVDRESVLIPLGWDNESKINILIENNLNSSIRFDSDDYESVISKPLTATLSSSSSSSSASSSNLVRTSGHASKTATPNMTTTIGSSLQRPHNDYSDIINAAEDSEFLSKLQIHLNKLANAVPSTTTTTTSLPATSTSTTTPTIQPTAAAAATSTTTKPDELAAANSMPIGHATSPLSTTTTGSISPSLSSTTPTIKSQHKTTPTKLSTTADSTNLKSFFQNLLAKNTPNVAQTQLSSPQLPVKEEPDK